MTIIRYNMAVANMPNGTIRVLVTAQTEDIQADLCERLGTGTTFAEATHGRVVRVTRKNAEPGSAEGSNVALAIRIVAWTPNGPAGRTDGTIVLENIPPPAIAALRDPKTDVYFCTMRRGLIVSEHLLLCGA